MAKVLNLYEAKTQLSALVDEAAAGMDLVIAMAGVPLARLVAFKATAKRRPGGWEGRIRMVDDFDAPLPADVLRAFEGTSLEPGKKRKA